MRYLTVALPFLPLLTLALPAPPSPLVARQDSSSSNPAIARAVADIFGSSFAAFSSNNPANAASTSTSGSGGEGSDQGQLAVEVAYDNCASGSSVSKVSVEPCEGGSGAEGDACVFTQGKNYTITISFTSPDDVPQEKARTSLASYDGDIKTAYSGQSFGACSYTSCPIQAGVAATYTYPFRTYAAPDFDRLVFNATNGIGGNSIMCANVPVSFKAA